MTRTASPSETSSLAQAIELFQSYLTLPVAEAEVHTKKCSVHPLFSTRFHKHICKHVLGAPFLDPEVLLSHSFLHPVVVNIDMFLAFPCLCVIIKKFHRWHPCRFQSQSNLKAVETLFRQVAGTAQCSNSPEDRTSPCPLGQGLIEHPPKYAPETLFPESGC